MILYARVPNLKVKIILFIVNVIWYNGDVKKFLYVNIIVLFTINVISNLPTNRQDLIIIFLKQLNDRLYLRNLWYC